MTKYKVGIVSNSLEYADQLKRTSIFNEYIDITFVARNINELKNKLNENTDVYIISDILGNSDTIEDVIELLQSTDALVYAILKTNNYISYLDDIGVGYAFEDETTPLEVIDLLSESLVSMINDDADFDTEPIEKTKEEPIKKEVEQTEYNNNSNMDTKSIYEYKPISTNNNTSSKETIQNPYTEQNNFNRPKPQQRGKTTVGIMKNKIVSFTSSKGGVGKSSISIEVASCLAHRAKQVEVNLTNQRGMTDKINVCLVDLNFAFGTMPSTLECVINAPKQVTLLDWVVAIQNKIIKNLDLQTKRNLQSQTYPDYISELKKLNRNDIIFTRQEILDLLICDTSTGLYILPTVSSPLDVDSVKREYISIIIEELTRVFDIIVIDTGNNLSHFTSEAYYLSDEIYIVGQPVLSVGVILKQLLDASINKLGIDKDKFSLVINHPNLSNKGLDTRGMANSLGIPLVAEIPYDENLGRAHENGLYYSINNKKKKFSYEIALLANRICPLWNVANKPKKSFMGKLFG